MNSFILMGNEILSYGHVIGKEHFRMNVFLSKKQQTLPLQGKPGTEETTMLQSVVLIMGFHQVKAQLSLKAS